VLDADGHPRSDPAAIPASNTLLPMCDHKGAGPALTIELVTGALGGSLMNHETVQRDGISVHPEVIAERRRTGIDLSTRR
jgi:LDH2 family malate/lactate/ureidoglycolate dehydrogenase